MTEKNMGAGQEAFEERIRNAVEAHGLMVMGVGGSPAFSYTVGCHKSLNSPEFIMSGFDVGLMHQLLNGLFMGIRNGHVTIPAEGGLVDKVLEGYPVKLVPVADEVSAKITLAAQNYYGGQIYKTMQMQLPDVNGKFPGDQGCDPTYEQYQSLAGAAGLN